MQAKNLPHEKPGKTSGQAIDAKVLSCRFNSALLCFEIFNKSQHKSVLRKSDENIICNEVRQTIFRNNPMFKSGSLGVAIVSDILSFPEGYAATNYIRLIGKGLIYAGARVQLLLPVFTEKPQAPLNVKDKGIYESIQFEYTTGTPVPPKNFFIRQCKKLRSMFMFPYRLIQLRQKCELDAVILYSRSYYQLLRLLWLRQITNVPVIVYMSEWSLAFSNRPPDRLKREKRFYEKALSSADGIIVISKFLENICRKEISKAGRQIPVLRMPIFVDPTKWSGIEPVKIEHQYLLYVANLNNYIDDALFLVDAFSKVKPKDCDMIIVGNSSEESLRRINKAASKADVGHRIHIKTNFISEKTLLSYYAGAIALLAPLRNDTQSLARFPFKIGDYLMSGRPVVSCSIGEVAEFLKDGETAFLSEPENADLFAEKMQEAIVSNKSEMIGRAGRRVAEQHFDYRNHGNTLCGLIKTSTVDIGNT